MAESRSLFEKLVSDLLDIKEQADTASAISNIEFKAYVDGAEGRRTQAGYIRCIDDLFAEDGETITLPGQTTIAVEIHNRGGDQTPTSIFNRLSAGKDDGQSFEADYIYYETVCHLELDPETKTISVSSGFGEAESRQQFEEGDLGGLPSVVNDMIRQNPSYIPEPPSSGSALTL